MTGRHGDYIASGSADLSMRCGECPDDDACEELRAFEVSFAIPITMTQDYQRRLLDLLSELVAEPYNQPKDGVHWVGFVGSRLTFSAIDQRVMGAPKSAPGQALPADGEEPTQDDSIFAVVSDARGFGWTKERDRVNAERKIKWPFLNHPKETETP